MRQNYRGRLVLPSRAAKYREWATLFPRNATLIDFTRGWNKRPSATTTSTPTVVPPAPPSTPNTTSDRVDGTNRTYSESVQIAPVGDGASVHVVDSDETAECNGGEMDSSRDCGWDRMGKEITESLHAPMSSQNGISALLDGDSS